MEAKENVTVLRSSAVSALQGEKKLSGITVRDLKSGSEQELSVDGLFIAVGQMPQNDRFSDLVELESGYIKAGENCRTSCPGIFAAGDCRTKTVRQLATAAGDGAVAALAALEYLQKK